MTVHHRSRRLARLLATGAAAGALAAPSAVARPIDPLPTGSPPDAGGTVVAVEPEQAPTDAPVIVRSVDRGFEWGSAAIGAGVGGALIVLVSLGVASASHDRIRVAR